MKLKTLILLSVILIGTVQVCFVTNWQASTTLVGPISYLLMVFIYIIYRQIDDKTDFENRRVMTFYLILGIIAIFRGFFEAKNYWDWKFLFFDSALVMLVPLIGFVGSDKKITQVIYYNYFKYLIPISFYVYFAAKHSDNTDGYTRFLSPLYVIIIFFPVLTKKIKIIIGILVLMSFFSDLGSRSNLIRIIAAGGLMTLYYFQEPIQKKVLKVMHIAFFALPILFFLLASTDIFNVFKIGEDYGDQYVVEKKLENGQLEEDDMTTDTRTFLYQEVLNSGIKRGTWLFGESASAGYQSDFFWEISLATKGRQRSEVSILNVFNVFGLIGVIAFTLVYFYASYLCIYVSNSVICKLLGLFIAFRWTFAWIEEFFDFSINFFFLWLIIGLCFSKAFRAMNDDEFKNWVLGMFDKKHIEDETLVY